MKNTNLAITTALTAVLFGGSAIAQSYEELESIAETISAEEATLETKGASKSNQETKDSSSSSKDEPEPVSGEANSQSADTPTSPVDVVSLERQILNGLSETDQVDVGDRTSATETSGEQEKERVNMIRLETIALAREAAGDYDPARALSDLMEDAERSRTQISERLRAIEESERASAPDLAGADHEQDVEEPDGSEQSLDPEATAPQTGVATALVQKADASEGAAQTESRGAPEIQIDLSSVKAAEAAVHDIADPKEPREEVTQVADEEYDDVTTKAEVIATESLTEVGVELEGPVEAQQEPSKSAGEGSSELPESPEISPAVNNALQRLNRSIRALNKAVTKLQEAVEATQGD